MANKLVGQNYQTPDLVAKVTGRAGNGMGATSFTAGSIVATLVVSLVAVAVAAVAGVPSKALFTTEIGSRLPFASTPNTVHSTVV